MRVLVSSYSFPPSHGGTETACLMASEGFVSRGHDVTVVTSMPATPGEKDRYPFEVVRCPSLFEQARLVRVHDVLWQNGLCLRLPGLFTSLTPKVFVHHLPPQHPYIQRLVCRTGTNVYVSRMMQELVGLPGVVIPNAYDEETFRLLPGVERDLDFAYVGRLVREKGVDVFIDALALLGERRFTATIIGAGPEEGRLKAQVEASGLADRVKFPGIVHGASLSRLLNRHRVLVVPSRWEEPFGIVALEGAACGCVAVGTRSGGLVEAIGPCGPIVPKENPQALAASLIGLIDDPTYLARFRDCAPAHLQQFTRKRLIEANERVLSELVGAAESTSIASWHAEGAIRTASPEATRLDKRA
jgi:glycosyltransferase involved in cell wall biosynthesis